MPILNIFSGFSHYFFFTFESKSNEMKKISHILLILFVSIATLFGGERVPLKFRYITTDDGLRSNSIKSLCQDEYGFVWVGTLLGLSRYDSKTFKYYPIENSPTNIRSLAYDSATKKLWIGTYCGVYTYSYLSDKIEKVDVDNANNVQINSIAIDSLQKVWLASYEAGVICYDQQNKSSKFFESTKNSSSNKNSPIHTNEITQVMIDSDSRVWILSLDGGVHLYEPRSETFQNIEIVASNGVKDGAFQSGIIAHNGSLWLGGWNKGLFKIERGNSRITNYPIRRADGTMISHIHSVEEISENMFLIGSDDGLYYFDATTGFYSQYEDIYQSSYGVNDKFIYPILKDIQGNIWVGTYFSGLNFAARNSVLFDNCVSAPGEKKLNGRIISCFCEDDKGNIWVGTDDAGVYRYNKNLKTIQRVIISQNDEPLNIHALMYRDECLWVGTYQRGVFKYDNVKKRSEFIDGVKDAYSFCVDSNNKLWIGSLNGLYYYDNENKKAKKEGRIGNYKINKLTYLNGNLWISLLDFGLVKYDIQSDKFSTIMSEGFATDKLGQFAVDGTQLVLNIFNDGIYIFDTESEKLNDKPILKKDLEQTNVTSILAQGNNYIISTSNGIFVYDKNSGKRQKYTKEDGLISNQFNYGALYYDSDSTIYAGGLGGFSMFKSDKFVIGEDAPPFVFSDFKILNHSQMSDEVQKPMINLNRRITLEYAQNTFSVNFTYLNYQSPENNGYFYKLDNFDKQHIFLDSKLSGVTYTNVPYGEYCLEVFKINSRGEWSDESEKLYITILPPWWLSLPMKFVYFLLAAVACYVAVLRFKRRIEKKNNEKIEKIKIENEQKIVDAKIDFVTHIAHEIRTPAALIAAPLEDIFRNHRIEDKELEESLQIVQKNSTRLVSLVNQVLSYRRVDEPYFKLKNKVVDLKFITTGIISQFSIEAKNRNIKINLISDESTEYLLYIDTDAFSKIASNLLSNALKFCNGQIDIVLNKKDEQSLLFTVVDNGRGIDGGEIADIFKPFYTTDNLSNNSNKGFGIGLSLVSQLTSKMGIKVDVSNDNELGGAKFILEIPCHLEENQDERPTLEELDNDKNRRSMVLIVEDNTDFLHFLKKGISSRYDVMTAENGQQALDIVKNKYVDIIISDVSMPVMDGFQLCQELRLNDELSHLPIVLLTAHGDTDNKISGLKIGADVYLEKPIAVDFLIAQIDTILEKRKLVRESFIKSASTPFGQGEQSGVETGFTADLAAIIEKNISDTEFSVDQLAAAVNMSRSTLYSKLKRVSNLTPNDYIRVVRLRKAAEYLLSGDYRIGEVSYMVGFNKPSYFSRCFQELYGVLPKQYVSSVRENKKSK